MRVMFGLSFNPADQIARHALGKPARADKQINVLRCSGKEDRSLSGRVASSHDDDFFAGAELRLQASRAVVDAYSLNRPRFGTGSLRYSTPVGPGHGMPQDRSATGAFDAKRPPLAFQSRCESSNRDLCPELFCLDEGPSSEVLPGNTRRKSEIILDARTRPRLPARAHCSPERAHPAPLRRHRLRRRARTDPRLQRSDRKPGLRRFQRQSQGNPPLQNCSGYGAHDDHGRSAQECLEG